MIAQGLWVFWFQRFQRLRLPTRVFLARHSHSRSASRCRHWIFLTLCVASVLGAYTLGNRVHASDAQRALVWRNWPEGLEPTVTSSRFHLHGAPVSVQPFRSALDLDQLAPRVQAHWPWLSNMWLAPGQITLHGLLGLTHWVVVLRPVNAGGTVGFLSRLDMSSPPGTWTCQPLGAAVPSGLKPMLCTDWGAGTMATSVSIWTGRGRWRTWVPRLDAPLQAQGWHRVAPPSDLSCAWNQNPSVRGDHQATSLCASWVRGVHTVTWLGDEQAGQIRLLRIMQEGN